ncbi:MAG: SCO family protein [Thiohalorhabdaceae bacterium]
MGWSRRRKILLLLSLIALNLGALFVVGRLPLDGTKAVAAPMLERAGTDTALIFFVFPGCSSSCPVTLRRLARAYPTLRDRAGGLDVFFVNLRPLPERERTRAYVHAYDPRFHAIAPDEAARKRLSRRFGAWLYRTGPESEPYHNPYVYLVVRHRGQWRIRHRIPADSQVVPEVKEALARVAGEAGDPKEEG